MELLWAGCLRAQFLEKCTWVQLKEAKLGTKWCSYCTSSLNQTLTRLCFCSRIHRHNMYTLSLCSHAEIVPPIKVSLCSPGKKKLSERNGIAQMSCNVLLGQNLFLQENTIVVGSENSGGHLFDEEVASPKYDGLGTYGGDLMCNVSIKRSSSLLQLLIPAIHLCWKTKNLFIPFNKKWHL
jgi:hypothetical protein